MKGKNRCDTQLDFFRVRSEQEHYDNAIILFEGLPRDYEDARNNFRE